MPGCSGCSESGSAGSVWESCRSTRSRPGSASRCTSILAAASMRLMARSVAPFSRARRGHAPGVVELFSLILHGFTVSQQLFGQVMPDIAAQGGVDQTRDLDPVAQRHAARAFHQPGVNPESEVFVGRTARRILLVRLVGMLLEKPGDCLVVHLILGRPSMIALRRGLALDDQAAKPNLCLDRVASPRRQCLVLQRAQVARARARPFRLFPCHRPSSGHCQGCLGGDVSVASARPASSSQLIIAHAFQPAPHRCCAMQGAGAGKSKSAGELGYYSAYYKTNL